MSVAANSFPQRYASMAKRPLKVFRTDAGFQDAYVAATSQKAALEAWGARTNLFASGLAELVTDPKLTKAPLAQPGIVIRTSRGTAAQHLAAAGNTKKPAVRKGRAQAPIEEEPAPPKPKKPVPRPSRAKLDRAEAALAKKEQVVAGELAAIDETMNRLRRERDALRSKRDGEIRKLEDRRDAEDEAYRSALNAWDG